MKTLLLIGLLVLSACAHHGFTREATDAQTAAQDRYACMQEVVTLTANMAPQPSPPVNLPAPAPRQNDGGFAGGFVQGANQSAYNAAAIGAMSQPNHMRWVQENLFVGCMQAKGYTYR